MAELQSPFRNLGRMVPLVSQSQSPWPPKIISAKIAGSDIAYYGINLNQSVILTKIGYAKGPNAWTTLWNIAVGNVIIQSAVRNSFSTFILWNSV